MGFGLVPVSVGEVATDPLLLPVLLMATTAFCRWRWIALRFGERFNKAFRQIAGMPLRISGATFAPRLGERHERQHAFACAFLSRSRLFQALVAFPPQPVSPSSLADIALSQRQGKCGSPRRGISAHRSRSAPRFSAVASHPSETSRFLRPNSGPSAEQGAAEVGSRPGS